MAESKKKDQDLQPKRLFKGQTEIPFDLFKLLPAYCKKNLGFHIDFPILDSVIHQHYFYSVDNDGKKHIHCGAIAGHTHRCEVVEENGELKLKVGPAIQIVKGKEVPCNVVNASATRGDAQGGTSAIIDNHTHEGQYIRSEMIKYREHVQAAQALIAERAKKEASLGL